ncbi:MAG TPA: 30S ribosomal protein S16 [Anaerolineales bacterium]|nr:30S ribosomal protein S16 [Anaerolineales bacterium]HRF47701.1 30S ribosomal protein S16 [Anaerolineales bacterium]
MVRIRLRKVGSRHQISFRLVAAESEHPRDGRFIQELGHYNPRTNPSTIVIDEAKVYAWLKNGAQPSESALKLLKQAGTLDRFTRFKAGEAVEALVAEAEAAGKTRNLSARTSDSAAQRKPRMSKRQQAKAKAAAGGAA